jgi:hypothetical protein
LSRPRTADGQGQLERDFLAVPLPHAYGVAVFSLSANTFFSFSTLGRMTARQ